MRGIPTAGTAIRVIDPSPRRPTSRVVAALSAVALVVTGVACESSGEVVRPSQPPTPAIDAADRGVFVDPEGTYSLEIDPDWQANHGALVAEIEVWLVATPQGGGFVPNVNVLTQAAPGMTTESYLRLSIDNAPAFFEDFELITEDIVTGVNGDPLGAIEYTGGGLQYLSVFAVGDDQAVVATLTAPPTRFAAIRDEVMPYLLTLDRLLPD